MSANFEPLAGKLLIHTPDNEHSHVKLFISEPTPLEEKNLGKIFILTEIESNEEIYKELTELINDEFNHHYYRSENFDLEAAFEQALQKVNRKLQEAISEIGSEWLNKLNIVITVLKDTEMHFTQLGSAQAFLVQKNQIINIIDSTKSKSHQINPLKIFSNVLSGQLTPQSSVIFCTESLLDYLSPEKIKKTLIENKPSKATEYLENLLSENGGQTNFAALIIRLQTISRPALQNNSTSTDENSETINDSMDNLVSKERVTTELLSPSLWSSMKGSLSKNEENATIEPLKPASKKIDNSEKKTNQKILLFLKNAGLKTLTGLAWFFGKIINSLRKPKEYKTKFNSLPGKTSNKISQIIDWFKKLTLSRKILLGLVIVLVFVFAQTIVYKGKSQESTELVSKYEQNISEAETKINEAKADLLMNNESGAREKLQTAEKLLIEIPKDSDIYEEKGSSLTGLISDQLNKINHLENISEPLQVADYSQIDPNIDLQSLTLIGDNLYAFDAQNDSVYRSKLETKEATTIVKGTDQISALTKDSAATVLISRTNGSFAQFNPVLEKYSEVTVESENKNITPKAMVTYGPRLYILDNENGEIWKHTKTGDLYESGSAWLGSDKINVKNGLSIAIDGAIYVLKSEGEVIKLYSGVKEKDFALEEFSPALTGASKIYTDENTKNLYVLDPSENRLVIFNKNGELIEQYTSDSFSNLKDMVVDEANKKVYLLAEAQVYQIEL